MTPTSRGRAAAAAAAAVLVLAGCTGGDSDDEPGAASASPSSQPTSGGKRALPQDDGGPLEGLPGCEEPPAGEPVDVEGLSLPDEAVVTSVSEQGPLTTVQGYVAQTPITVRRFYEGRDDIQVLEIEDEVLEAEVLYAGGEFRTYVKAQAACAEGSTLLAVVGPAGDAVLPSFGGS